MRTLLDYEASPAFCSILTTSAVISDSHSDHRIDVSLTHRYFYNYLPGAFGDDRGQAGGAGLDGAMKMQSWQVDRKVMRYCFREGQKRACDALSSMVVTPA